MYQVPAAGTVYCVPAGTIALYIHIQSPSICRTRAHLCARAPLRITKTAGSVLRAAPGAARACGVSGGEQERPGSSSLCTHTVHVRIA